ncbi:MAG: phosphoribosylglycinamide formyltransferase [Bacteroidota bacterium]
MKPVNIAIFASGAGSNARALLSHFSNDPAVRVAVVISNKAGAGVHEVAQEFDVPSVVLGDIGAYESNLIEEMLSSHQVDFIVLAGFLLKVPDSLVQLYANRIINIHPALLPKFGGKGMYGNRVHAAVKAQGETETGITIHYVNEHYDEGAVIFQASCPVAPEDSEDDIRKKVQELEHLHFPAIVSKVVKGEL